MDMQTARRLCQLNNDFYQANHASFSDTRRHAWPGWTRVMESVAQPPASVLDVACGNARFKSFLDTWGARDARYFAVDSCAGMFPSLEGASFQQLDIVSALFERRLPALLEATECDLVACFGFMHHVPSRELRARFLDALVEKTRSGGILALSFWQFALDAHMHEKAQRTTERGCEQLGLSLGEGDYLLGWKDVEGAYRYCHSFDDDELDELVAHCAHKATLCDRFSADGRTNAMNRYLVFRGA